jgi:hypothetical protein
VIGVLDLCGLLLGWPGGFIAMSGGDDARSILWIEHLSKLTNVQVSTVASMRLSRCVTILALGFSPALAHPIK